MEAVEKMMMRYRDALTDDFSEDQKNSRNMERDVGGGTQEK